MVRRLVVLAAIAASCAPRTYKYSDISAPLVRTPVFGRGHVYVPVVRYHQDHYDVDPTFRGGSTDGDTQTTDVDDLGAIDVDLVTGTCVLVDKPGPAAASAWVAIGPADPLGVRSIAGSDAIVHFGQPDRREPRNAGQVKDRSSGAFWAFEAGIAVVDGHMFMPTQNEGVIELSMSPVALVTRHLPPRHRPDPTKYRWAASHPWKDGETFAGITLHKTGGRTVLELYGTTVDIADAATPVTLFESVKRAATPTHLIRLDALTNASHGMVPIAGIPRIASIANNGYYYVEVGGEYQVAADYTDELQPPSAYLDTLGYDGKAITLADQRYVYQFAPATGTWREISFERCIPPR